MTDPTPPLLTDLYQLTMIAAYLDSGKARDEATFDLFVRKLPKDWGYLVAAGIDDAIDTAISLKFTKDDIEYLAGTGLFQPHHLDYLREFTFTGTIRAVPEGTPVGTTTPLVSVTGERAQAQLLETILINAINHPTMVASKASRTAAAGDGAPIAEFGLRRAHGREAGLAASRAAYLGGASSTSDVEAGKRYGIPITGTMAHSFVMAFPTELEAFRAYVRTFPHSPTLLIDTYDTIEGAKNAIIVAKELQAEGKCLGAVRLDSGDLGDLADKVSALLRAADLPNVRIIASGDLNEYKVDDLKRAGHPIDAFGVGTELVTGKPDAALSMVYKLVEDAAGGKMKLAPGKRTWPGKKQVYRVYGDDRSIHHDTLALESEPPAGIPLLETIVSHGARTRRPYSLTQSRKESIAEVARLPAPSRRIREAVPYDARPSNGLKALAARIEKEHTEVHA